MELETAPEPAPMDHGDGVRHLHTDAEDDVDWAVTTPVPDAVRTFTLTLSDWSSL